MNYEEKYKSALEWIRSIYPTMQGADKEDAEHYFPELKESEDERIRKEIIELVHFFYCSSSVYEHHVSEDDMIAWLEKQGDSNKEYWRGYREGKKEILDKYSELEKQGEQKPAWSEEDEKILKRIDCLLYSQCAIHGSEYEELHKWLKSLKPNHWKPSEQNIKDLEWCADLVKDKMGVGFHRLQVFIDEIKTL